MSVLPRTTFALASKPRLVSSRLVWAFILGTAFGTSAAFTCAAAVASNRDNVVVTKKWFHLRTASQPEWNDFQEQPVDGADLVLEFTARDNPGEQTLFLRQRDVKYDWIVQLNDRTIGKLVLAEPTVAHTLALPPHALRDGTNRLHIFCPKEQEDIFVGDMKIDPRPKTQAIGESDLMVNVRDENGIPIPARITIIDDQGAQAALLTDPTSTLASRPGVVYSRSGTVRIHLPAGKYDVYASRGFEYGMDHTNVMMLRGELREMNLRIRHEVDTRGWISCDTHVHTFTHSRHGDSSIEERMVTLAGEGIELPIATDHNKVIDYAKAQKETECEGFFTSVIGSEVTTDHGHFNVFPLSPEASEIEYRAPTWTALFASIRRASPQGLIILNHPTDAHAGFRPFDRGHIDSSSGVASEEFPIGFDALELVVSGALQTDFMEPYRTWFALLNRGHRLTGVGSSDSHDVNRYIVGQSRTYIRAADEHPGKIDVKTAVENLREGHAIVSFGLFPQLRVNDRFESGDLATNVGATIQVKAVVRGPSWTSCNRVMLFANGVIVHDEAVPASANKPGSDIKAQFQWSLARPATDSHLVLIATGPGDAPPFWPIMRSYQPKSKDWAPRWIGSTNPIWIDADNDGKWTSPPAARAN